MIIIYHYLQGLEKYGLGGRNGKYSHRQKNAVCKSELTLDLRLNDRSVLPFTGKFPKVLHIYSSCCIIFLLFFWFSYSLYSFLSPSSRGIKQPWCEILGLACYHGRNPPFRNRLPHNLLTVTRLLFLASRIAPCATPAEKRCDRGINYRAVCRRVFFNFY